MKRVSYFLLLTVIIFFSGCQLLEDNANNHSSQTNSYREVKREKGFGKFDYLDISQKEAEQRLPENFSVQLPEEYAQGLALLQESLQTEANIGEEPRYSIKATGDTLLLRGTFAYKNIQDQKYYSSGTIELTYQYNQKKKKSWLESQEITITNYTGNQCVYINDPIQTLASFGQLANVDINQQKMVEVTKVFKKKPEERINEKIYLENSMKTAQMELSIGKNIGIYFNEDGIFEKLFMYIRTFS